MSTEMILDAAQRQLTAADEALAAWKPVDSPLAGLAGYAENAILLFLDRQAVMRRVVERMQKLARGGQTPNLLQLWYEGDQLFQNALAPAAGHRELLAALVRAGFVVEGAGQFEESVRELERLRREFCQTMPLASPEEAVAFHSAISRGEFQDADEAFAEIAGVDLEAWRGRANRARRKGLLSYH
jgi:hypothetical protein